MEKKREKKPVMENYILEDETGWSHIMIWEVILLILFSKKKEVILLIYDVKQIRRSKVM